MTHGRADRAPARRFAVVLALIAALTLGVLAPAADAQQRGKLRTIVTTDPELDDQNSMIRYLLRSNDFDTEGLIYASSAFHWRGDGRTKWWQPDREYDRFGLSGVCPCLEWRWPAEGDQLHIEGAVERYAEAYDNLKIHDPDYPTPNYLRSKIREGNVQFDSDISISGDTPGSDLIKDVLLDNEGGPVYLMAWGGPSTIARALKSIQLQYQGTRRWGAIHRKVSRKAIIVSFGKQDYSYRDYISVSWPDIELREAATTTWGYFARAVALPENAESLSAEWTRENVSSKGPLGEFYRVWGDNKFMAEGDIFDFFGFSGLTQEQLREMGYVAWMPPQEKDSFISEGDTSTFMTLVDNGLRSFVHPTWGGWGGRLAQDPEDPSEWSAAGTADEDAAGDTPADYAAQRWFGDAQRDFAARLRWSVTPDFEDANHHPKVNVSGRLDRYVKRGVAMNLKARATDPDGDALSYRWWHYREAGVDPYQGDVDIQNADAPTARFVVPADAEPGRQIHVILQVTDNGSPALTSYQRVVVTVSPRR